jgi:exonuclease III
MSAQSSIASIITYNCHGFNQGKAFLNALCNSKDIPNSPSFIFLQELWLTPDNTHKIDNFSNDYVFYGISAMEHKVSNSVLIGRPSGGVGILVKHNLAHLIRYSETCERFVCVVLSSTIFINVYLPSIKSDSDKEIFIDPLSCIEVLLSNYKDCKIVWGGDLNLSLVGINNIDWAAKMFKQFMQVYDLMLCDNFVCDENSLQYTFFNHAACRYSLIDYFIVSRQLFDSVQDCVIIDSPINMSDHNPVILKISDCIESIVPSAPNKSSGKCTSTRSKNILRWDRSDLNLYYNCTFELFKPIWHDMKAFMDSHIGYTNEASIDLLEHFYENIIQCLNRAATENIVKKKLILEILVGC